MMEIDDCHVMSEDDCHDGFWEMKYKDDLTQILDFVKKYPGKTANGLCKTLKENGEDINASKMGKMIWMLRYLECAGYIYCDDKRRWFAFIR